MNTESTLSPMNNPQTNRWVTSSSVRIAACIPTVLVWGMAAGFSLLWIEKWSVGALEPGRNTIMQELIVFFFVTGFIASLGMTASVMVCIKRWTFRWQAVLFVLGLLAFWMVWGG